MRLLSPLSAINDGTLEARAVYPGDLETNTHLDEAARAALFLVARRADQFRAI